MDHQRRRTTTLDALPHLVHLAGRGEGPRIGLERDHVVEELHRGRHTRVRGRVEQRARAGGVPPGDAVLHPEAGAPGPQQVGVRESRGCAPPVLAGDREGAVEVGADTAVVGGGSPGQGQQHQRVDESRRTAEALREVGCRVQHERRGGRVTGSEQRAAPLHRRVDLHVRGRRPWRVGPPVELHREAPAPAQVSVDPAPGLVEIGAGREPLTGPRPRQRELAASVVDPAEVGERGGRDDMGPRPGGRGA